MSPDGYFANELHQPLDRVGLTPETLFPFCCPQHSSRHMGAAGEDSHMS